MMNWMKLTKKNLKESKQWKVKMMTMRVCFNHFIFLVNIMLILSPVVQWLIKL